MLHVDYLTVEQIKGFEKYKVSRDTQSIPCVCEDLSRVRGHEQDFLIPAKQAA